MLPTTSPRHPRLLRRPGRSRRPRQRATALLGALGVLAALCALLLGTASPASAHAALTGSSPAAGSVVSSAPGKVTLTFSEKLAMSDDSIRVLAPDGKRVDAGGLEDLSTGGTVKYGVPLPGGSLGEGTYTVAWKAVSADSHPISGAFTFSVGAPSKTSVGLPDSEAGGGTTGFLYDVARYLAYGGFVVLVGGAAFVLGCWQQGAKVAALQRLVSGGWAVLTAATVAMLLLRGPYSGSDGGLSDAFDLTVLRETLDTKPGTALVSRLLLLAAAAVFLSVLFGTYARTPEQAASGSGSDSGSGSGSDGKREGKGHGPVGRTPAERRDLFFGLALGGGVVAAGLAATWAMSEHASTGIQTSLAMPVAIIHLLAVACWLGGLTSLLTALFRGAPPSVAGTRRFSRLAFTSVVVLAATGLYQSWRQVGSWSALTGTDYGLLLLLKLGLIAGLVGLGWFSRRWTGRLIDSASASAADPEAAPATTRDEADTDSPDSPEGTDSTDGTDTTDSTDPVRAGQLARQRTAVATARRKRALDADPLRAGLRRSVLYEASVAVVILAVATLLSGTEPGRAEEAEQGSGGSSASASKGPAEVSIPFDTGGPNGKGTARITIDPGRTGNNALTVRATGPGGKPLAAEEVQVALTEPAKDIGPLRSTPEPDPAGKGRWKDAGIRLPVAGSWRVAVTIRTSDIDQVTETKTVRIG